MGKLGREDVLLEIMRSYWGGMLKRGAVTFWEQFDPSAEGSDQYAMYGDPYGKSLCHAWGASPNYLIARYLCGVAPVKPGYEKFKIEPLGIRCLDEFHAVVPVGRGNLAIDWSDGTLTVCSDVEGGTLILKKQEYPVPANEVLQIKEEQFRSGN